MNRKKLYTTRLAVLLQEGRRASGLNQEKLAALMNVSQGYISRLESSDLIPSAHLWNALCEELGIPPRSPYHEYKYVRALRRLRKLKSVQIPNIDKRNLDS